MREAAGAEGLRGRRHDDHEKDVMPRQRRQMLDFGFYNMDCLKGMKEFPDKYFDLAIVDPPYGGGFTEGGGCQGWFSKYHQATPTNDIGGAALWWKV